MRPKWPPAAGVECGRSRRASAPRYIASEASYAVAAHAALDAWAATARRTVRPDAVLVGCFGDPGVFGAARGSRACRSSAWPKAAMREAARFGRFAIVTGGAAWGPMLGASRTRSGSTTRWRAWKSSPPTAQRSRPIRTPQSNCCARHASGPQRLATCKVWCSGRRRAGRHGARSGARAASSTDRQRDIGFTRLGRRCTRPPRRVARQTSGAVMVGLVAGVGIGAAGLKLHRGGRGGLHTA